MANRAEGSTLLMVEEKTQLRDQLRDRLASYSSEDLSAFSLAISHKIIELSKQNKEWKRFAGFKAKGPEVCLDLAYDQFLTEDKSLCFPKVKRDREMDFYWSNNNDFHLGAFGVREPTGTDQVSSEDIDCIFVPALGYDKKGSRIGQGRAFYDHYLDRCGATRVGVAYSFQILETEIPREAHDQAVQMIVTEKEVIRLEKES